MTAYQAHQEDIIRRARQIAPNDERLTESSGDDAVRTESWVVACELLGESA